MHELFTQNKGCKLLVLDSSHMRKNSIVAEGENLTEDLLLLNELKEIKQHDPSVKINIDILVLLSEKSENLAKFAHDAGIPVVVYFDLKHKSSHFTDLLTTYLNSEFKYNFLKRFIHYMIEG